MRLYVHKYFSFWARGLSWAGGHSYGGMITSRLPDAADELSCGEFALIVDAECSDAKS